VGIHTQEEDLEDRGDLEDLEAQGTSEPLRSAQGLWWGCASKGTLGRNTADSPLRTQASGEDTPTEDRGDLVAQGWAATHNLLRSRRGRGPPTRRATNYFLKGFAEPFCLLSGPLWEFGSLR
jgi:hypothetical protein